MCTFQQFWTSHTELGVSPFLHTYLFSILLPRAIFIFPVPDPFCCENEVRGFGHRGGCRKTSDFFQPTGHIVKTDTERVKVPFSKSKIKSIKKKGGKIIRTVCEALLIDSEADYKFAN